MGNYLLLRALSMRHSEAEHLLEMALRTVRCTSAKCAAISYSLRKRRDIEAEKTTKYRKGPYTHPNAPRKNVPSYSGPALKGGNYSPENIVTNAGELPGRGAPQCLLLGIEFPARATLNSIIGNPIPRKSFAAIEKVRIPPPNPHAPRRTTIRRRRRRT